MYHAAGQGEEWALPVSHFYSTIINRQDQGSTGMLEKLFFFRWAKRLDINSIFGKENDRIAGEGHELVVHISISKGGGNNVRSCILWHTGIGSFAFLQTNVFGPGNGCVSPVFNFVGAWS